MRNGFLLGAVSQTAITNIGDTMTPLRNDILIEDDNGKVSLSEFPKAGIIVIFLLEGFTDEMRDYVRSKIQGDAKFFTGGKNVRVALSRAVKSRELNAEMISFYEMHTSIVGVVTYDGTDME